MFLKYYTSLLFLIIPSMLFSQDYYWYGNKKVSLIPTDKKYVVTRNVDTVTATNVVESATNYQYTNSSDPSWNIISNAEFNNLDQSTLLYSSPSYINQDSNEIFVSHYFYVKLKNVNDSDILQDFAYRNNVTIEYQSTLLPLWYVLSCLYSDKNALEMANYFYESGLFEFAEPDFLSGKDESCSINDPMFGSQWNLMNTGQYGDEYIGIDINYDGVSQLIPDTTDIVVAVVDEGIQLDHPDLAANILGVGYDAETRSSPSVCYGPHGTNCAGIIGAISNNGIGISGIFNGQLMSISSKLKNDTLSYLKKAESIVYAVENGADVISNSWMSWARLSAIDEAIKYALSHGRNGLGCVVVFASGNSGYKEVLYPGDVSDSIIVVGGISPCGERKSPASCDKNKNWSGSNFGDKLDVVAPCTSIYTTNLMTLSTSGYCSFSGTSAACPHVAAIAGLILSVNPNLTCKQVADIIETTAREVGNYDYDIHPNRPNGRWHREMGYGLVDAYAAVLAAKTKYIQNHTYQSGSVIVENYPEIIAGYDVTDNKPYGNVILEAGSDVTYSATEQVVLKPGFHAKAGSNLHIKVDIPTTTQSTTASAPQRIAQKSLSAPIGDTRQTDEVATINSFENIESEVIVSTSIYTISGQLIQTISGGQHSAAHLPNGLYILQHRMSDGSMRSEKIANNK